MARDYRNMTVEQLTQEFCARSPNMYMELLAIAAELDKDGLIHILEHMDLDRAEGRKGPLLGPPPDLDPDDFP